MVITTRVGDRFITLDIVRGVAVMGILIMNIAGFALYDSAYFNPRAAGGSTGIDLITWIVNFIFVDGRMRGLFAFLFGASMLLVIQGAQAKGENAATVHFSRMFWLLLFGLAHLWTIWASDILHHYAIIGAAAWFFRNRSIAQLIGIGVACYVLALFVASGLCAAIVFAQAGAEATPPDPEAVAALVGLNNVFGLPSAEFMRESTADHASGFTEFVADQFNDLKFSPISSTFLNGGETLGSMLFGMAALKSGLLTGAWTRARYVRWATFAFAITVPLYAALAAWMLSTNFNLFSVATSSILISQIFRPVMVVGWACLIILLAWDGGALSGRIAAVGRMAFTNYLFTSVICSTLFNGYGFGLYMQLSRSELMLVVFAVWGLMLLWSKPWLEEFEYGPMEWLWRSLSRGSLARIRKHIAKPSQEMLAN